MFFTPAVVAVTFTETAHEAPAATVPLDKLTADDPVIAVMAPPQVFMRLLGVATSNPAGRLSVKAMPVRVALAFGLVMLNVSVIVPFSATVAAPNDFVIVGGPAGHRAGAQRSRES